MMNPAKIIQDWQCSLDILNETTYQRMQHVSLYNSIPTSTSNGYYLKKKKKNLINFRDRKHSMTKLLLVSHDKPLGKQNSIVIRVLDENNRKNSSVINSKNEVIFPNRKISEIIKENDNKMEALFVKQNSSLHRVSSKSNLSSRRSLLQQSTITSEKDKCFLYTHHMSSQIFKVIENSKEKRSSLKSFINDIELLVSNFQKNRSVFGTHQKMKIFKKEEGIFLLKNAEIRIMFHALLAEIEIYLNNTERAIEEFQFCQYNSRKESNEQLTICFLEQISQLNISILNYEQADQTLRNILELAIVYKKKKVLKYALQRISLVYYYRGNAIMGRHYLNKSQQGMTAFENEIYSRQFSQIDEIKRLENKLFNLKNEQKMVKRKNNPKFQFDIWRESKEDYEKHSYQSYMEKVNKMLKQHQNSKDGRKIMGMANKINCVGEVQRSLKKNEGKENLHLRKSTISSNLRNSQIKNCNINNNSNYFSTGGAPTIQNVTGVLKTHLSMNRENYKLTREQRWKKVASFVFSLLGQLKEIEVCDFSEIHLGTLTGFKSSDQKFV